jgi:hypothetical protein
MALALTWVLTGALSVIAPHTKPPPRRLCSTSSWGTRRSLIRVAAIPTPPAVLIQGGGGYGAAATALVSNGQVVGLHFTSAGCCYTNAPKIVIGSPPFVPTVSIAVSRVKVMQNVVLGRKYVLESSADLVTWTATGPEYIAEAEIIVNEFEVDVTGRYFRIRQVP